MTGYREKPTDAEGEEVIAKESALNEVLRAVRELDYVETRDVLRAAAAFHGIAVVDPEDEVPE